MIGVAVLTAAVSLCGGVLMLMNGKLAKILQKYGSGIAALILTAAVMFDLLPEAIEEGGMEIWKVLLIALGGFLLFALLGAVFGRWHSHGKGHEVQGRRQAALMVVVDGLHTIADGLVLGVGFAAGLSTGVWGAVAIAAHEIPRGVGDFAVLVRAKWPKRRIIRMQILVAILMVPAAVVAFLVGDKLMSGVPVMLALMSGFFMYIAFGEMCAIFRSWKSEKR